MLNCLGQNQIDSYSWNFGDGNIGTGQTISHTYTTNGIHTVTLQVNVNGVIRIITTNINTSAGVNFNVSVNLQ
jgi:PKD repeat protein